MSFFSTPLDNDPRFFGALVLAIDNQRSVCKVYTDFKSTLDGVPWMSNDPPQFNDRVLVTNIIGNAVILGVLDRIGVPAGYTPDIDAGTEIDTGNFSQLTSGLVNDPEKPVDIVGGDKIVSNPMGGIYGLLKGGSFFARASKLAQILLSKYDDLVRIVGRNYELFTDSCIEVAASVRGRIYKANGYSNSLANSRSDSYIYQEYYGDTVIADALKFTYYGLDPTSFAAIPVANDVIRKYVVTGVPNPLFNQELHTTGEYYTISQNSAGTNYTYVDQTNATFDVKTNAGTFTRITTTPTSVVITYNGTNIVTIDSTKIKLDYGGTNTVTITSSNIEGVHGSSNNKFTVDSTKSQLSYNNGLHTVSAVATGVELLFSGGTHFIRATSAGITMG